MKKKYNFNFGAENLNAAKDGKRRQRKMERTDNNKEHFDCPRGCRVIYTTSLRLRPQLQQGLWGRAELS